MLGVRADAAACCSSRGSLSRSSVRALMGELSCVERGAQGKAYRQVRLVRPACSVGRNVRRQKGHQRLYQEGQLALGPTSQIVPS